MVEKRKMSKRVIMRKERKYWTYSLTLPMEAIKWLQSKDDAPGLIREAVSKMMLAESAEESAKLRERAELLVYKYRVLTSAEGIGHNETEEDAKARIKEAHKAMEESQRLTKCAEEIEANIRRAEEEKTALDKAAREKSRMEEISRLLHDTGPAKATNPETSA